MKFTKVIAMLLCVVMVVAAFAGCTGKKTDDPKTPVEDPTYADPYEGKTHAEVSDELYEKVLGEFSKYYEEALAAESISERFALMAVAEAKLLDYASLHFQRRYLRYFPRSSQNCQLHFVGQ